MDVIHAVTDGTATYTQDLLAVGDFNAEDTQVDIITPLSIALTSGEEILTDLFGPNSDVETQLFIVSPLIDDKVSEHVFLIYIGEDDQLIAIISLDEEAEAILPEESKILDFVYNTQWIVHTQHLICGTTFLRKSSILAFQKVAAENV